MEAPMYLNPDLGIFVLLAFLFMAMTSIWGMLNAECWKSETRNRYYDDGRLKETDRYMVHSINGYLIFLVLGIATSALVFFALEPKSIGVGLLALVFFTAYLRACAWQRRKKAEHGYAGVAWVYRLSPAAA